MVEVAVDMANRTHMAEVMASSKTRTAADMDLPAVTANKTPMVDHHMVEVIAHPAMVDRAMEVAADMASKTRTVADTDLPREATVNRTHMAVAMDLLPAVMANRTHMVVSTEYYYRPTSI